jgi:hypothetical protein
MNQNRPSHYGKPCIFLIVSLIPYVFTSTKTKNIELSLSVLKFCEYNGMKYLSFYSYERNTFDVENSLRNMLQMSKSKRLLRTRQIQTPLDIRVQNTITYDQDVLVIVASDIAKTWEIYLNMIAKTKIKRALVVLVTPVQEDQLQEMLKIVQRLSENMYFYLTLTKAENESQRIWYHVISVKGNKRVLIQVVNFDKNGRL